METRSSDHTAKRSHGGSSTVPQFSLSDRVSEYYEKLVKTSHSKGFSSNQAQDGSSKRPEQTEEYLDTNSITLPRYQEGSPSRSFSVTSSHPYTLYVEDPSGSFQQFKKNKPLTAPITPPTASQQHSLSSRAHKSRSKSPPTAEETGCAQCSISHSPHSCPLKSRMAAEQDIPAYQVYNRNKSPRILQSNYEKSVEGGGSVQIFQPSSSRKGGASSSSQTCERDVIGQERSPVSKSQPIASLALSTSSSNGDTVPRERKKWVRPPLVGQASSSPDKSLLVASVAFDNLEDTHSKERNLSSSTGSENTETTRAPTKQKSSYFDSSSDGGSGVPLIGDEFFVTKSKVVGAVLSSQQQTSEGEQGLSDSCGGGRVSPSSSVTSSRRLEWDSGADVGYNQAFGSESTNADASGLCTIERMALAQGCSVALRLRLDPEGTTVPSCTGQGPVPPTPQHPKSIHQVIGKPTAESTPVDKAFKVVGHIQCLKDSQKTGISPIVNLQQQSDTVENGPPISSQIREAVASKPNADYGTNDTPIQPVQRQWSNSLQDLRKFPKKFSEGTLFKSQSDSDLAGDPQIIFSKHGPSKHTRNTHKGKNWLENNAAVHSISSGSDATLVHVETEEDLCTPQGRTGSDISMPQEALFRPTNVRAVNEEMHQPQPTTTEDLNPLLGGHSEEAKEFARDPHNNESKGGDGSQLPCPSPHVVFSQKPSSKKKHVCSDTDHRRGLHHHFGVLCSTVLGGHISAVLSAGLHPVTEQVCASVDEAVDETHMNRDESGAVTADSAPSSALHSDAGHEDSTAGGNTLTGRANSFEYLPGHVYENHNAGPGSSRHDQAPGISTSTETDSEPARPKSRNGNHRVVDSSSHDTEEDQLWRSPRAGSNTLVQDLERGLNLLKGVMENKSAGRRCKREVIRRVIRKLVSSEYVEDLIERERHKHIVHGPFSPRRSKHQDWPERHARPKRPFNNERQEVSGESDEPKIRIPTQRKKVNSYQGPPASQYQRTHSLLASGSKSSSLWSSQYDTTSGSISLSGSSDHQKTSKSSMKPNPLYKAPPSDPQGADWMEPTTQSEKLLELRKQYGGDVPVRVSTGEVKDNLNISNDPLKNCFPSDPKQQLCWVKNEINRLKLLKQLLQHKESGQDFIDPKYLPNTITAMPITSLKQTMKMADSSSPDIPDPHSPMLSGQRLQQWATLESDTSAFCGHSDSSRASQWQEIEVASAGEHDDRPHRTVSLSEGDENPADTVTRPSNRKLRSPASCSQNIPKTRRRSVNISDVGQLVGTHCHPDRRKSRSDRPAEFSDGRTYSSKAAARNAMKPQERVYSSDIGPTGICRNCQNAGHGYSSIDSRSTDSCLRGTSDPASAPAQLPVGSCLCEPAGAGTGAVRKAPHSTSSRTATLSDIQLVPQSGPQSMSRYIQTIDGSLRVHAQIEQEGNTRDSLVASVPVGGEADENDKKFLRPASNESVTEAVTEAVSSKVRALRNLGHIEEAEVKIRVKMGQPQADRVWKSHDTEEDGSSLRSKHTEMEDMIARQRALDQETRQKLLAIAGSRLRSQSGSSEADHRMEDLLLRDYLSRQVVDGQTHARVNVRIASEAQPRPKSEKVGQRREVATSTSRHACDDYSQVQDSLENCVTSNKSACVCGGSRSKGQPLSHAQTSRPRTAPAACACSCRSTPERLLKTLLNSPEKRLEFELEIRKQPPHRTDPLNVHQALKDRNKAYFLQFEEDETVQPPKEETPPERPPLEVVTIKVPRQKNSAVESSSSTPHGPVGGKVPAPPRGAAVFGGKNKHVSSNKENIASASQPDSKYSRHINTSSKSGNGRKMDDDVVQSFHSVTGSVSGKQDKNLADPRGKNRSLDSPREIGSSMEKSSSDFVVDRSSCLRRTPGRNHLSATASSIDSVRSPDGNSGSSSPNLPPRKDLGSRSPRRCRKGGDATDTSSKVFQVMAFRADTGTSSPGSSASIQAHRQPVPDGGSGSDHIQDEQPNTLQAYLEANYPEYLSAAEKRRRCIAEMAYLRRLRQQSRKRLLELEGDTLRAKQRQLRRARCLSRPRPAQRKRTPTKNIRAAAAKRCLQLPEVQQRLAELKRKEENRTNRLMAEIYTRKLQEKVLKGSATIRSSVSVISSI